MDEINVDSIIINPFVELISLLNWIKHIYKLLKYVYICIWELLLYKPTLFFIFTKQECKKIN